MWCIKCLIGSSKVVVWGDGCDNEMEKWLCHVVASRCCSQAKGWRCYLYLFLYTWPLFFSLIYSVVVIRSNSWPSDQFHRFSWFSVLISAMVDHLPPVLLEACVVVGASDDKLRDVYQVFAFKCTLTQTIKANLKAARHVEPSIQIFPVCLKKTQNADLSIYCTMYDFWLTKKELL